MGINKFNAEGYYDPTAYEAMTNIIKEEKAFFAFRPVVYICSPYDLDVQRQNMAREKSPVGRVTYVGGDVQEFSDAEAFLKCLREELPFSSTTGFRYKVLANDPAIRKAADDIACDFYGEENPRALEDYEPQQDMRFGGM